MLTKRIHHYSLKCATMEQLARVEAFYCGVLGMTVTTRLDNGLMIDCGGSYVQVFANGQGSTEVGAIRHIAFEVEDADACARAVEAAGYPVFLGPKDIEIPAHARIAFCHGPCGEEVEFFQLR